jgi:DHA2 family multidrug resistance protein
MLSLYLRGFGMGMVFTPLSSLALVDIPRERMAQASGMFNVVRQLGGSFGVAILATLLTSRFMFHNQNYSQSINSHSATYKNVTKELKNYYQYQTGSSPTDAYRLSQATIMSQVNKEAYIEAVDDDFLVSGFITIIGIFPVLLLRTKSKNKNKSKSHVVHLE